MEAESKKRRTPQRPRSPANLSDAQAVTDFSGFLIIRLKPGVVSTGVVSFRCDYGKQKKEIMRREVIVPYLRDAMKAARKDVPVIG